MLATILGLAAILLGIKWLLSPPSKRFGGMMPTGKPAKIMGVVHIAFGLFLLSCVAFNAVNHYNNSQLFQDAQSGAERTKNR